MFDIYENIVFREACLHAGRKLLLRPQGHVHSIVSGTDWALETEESTVTHKLHDVVGKRLLKVFSVGRSHVKKILQSTK